MKKTALTVFFSGTVHTRVEDKIVQSNQTTHFEIGQKIDEGQENERSVVAIGELLFGRGCFVKFSNGVTWKYRGFNYVIS